jgi:hypothetical protein
MEFLAKKGRHCNMERAPGSLYCGAHAKDCSEDKKGTYTVRIAQFALHKYSAVMCLAQEIECRALLTRRIQYGARLSKLTLKSATLLQCRTDWRNSPSTLR